MWAACKDLAPTLTSAPRPSGSGSPRPRLTSANGPARRMGIYKTRPSRRTLDDHDRGPGHWLGPGCGRQRELTGMGDLMFARPRAWRLAVQVVARRTALWAHSSSRRTGRSTQLPTQTGGSNHPELAFPLPAIDRRMEASPLLGRAVRCDKLQILVLIHGWAGRPSPRL
jgi:hypothetical protein